MLASTFGVSLAVATFGLYQFVTLGQGSPLLAQAAFVSSLIASVVFVLMASTQLAIGSEFPTPPASSGSIDLGPLSGLWYTAVTVQVIRSLGWAAERSTSVPTPPL